MKSFPKAVALAITLLLVNMLSGSMNVLSQTLIGKPWMPNGSVQSIAKHGDMVYVAGNFSAVGRPLPNGVLFDKTDGRLQFPIHLLRTERRISSKSGW